MKDYLNNSETKEMIVLNKINIIVDHFINGSVMDSTEKGNLKRGNTFIKKALLSTIKRLGEKEAKKFVKLYENSQVITISNSELSIIKKRKNSELNEAYEDSKEYYDLVEITMDMNCKNCFKNWKQCDLCKHFDENEVIPFNEEIDLGNCKYAYRG